MWVGLAQSIENLQRKSLSFLQEEGSWASSLACRFWTSGPHDCMSLLLSWIYLSVCLSHQFCFSGGPWLMQTLEQVAWLLRQARISAHIPCSAHNLNISLHKSCILMRHRHSALFTKSWNWDVLSINTQGLLPFNLGIPRFKSQVRNIYWMPIVFVLSGRQDKLPKT